MFKRLLRREPDDAEKKLAWDGEKPEPKKAKTIGDLASSLRADMFSATHAVPDKKFRFPRISLSRILAVVFMVGLVGVGWLFYAGPGRPVLENLLVSLAKREPTITPTIAATNTLPPPTNTPTPPPTATSQPSPTTTPVEATPEPTATLEPPTATVDTGCRDVLSVTLADVGQTLCVQGIVLRTQEFRDSAGNLIYFQVVLSDELNALYWVSYDMVWSQAQENQCYQVTGQIYQIYDNPVLIFSYGNIPQPCP